MSQAFILFDKDYKIILFNKTAADYTQKVTGLELKKGISFVDNIPENSVDLTFITLTEF